MFVLQNEQYTIHLEWRNIGKSHTVVHSEVCTFQCILENKTDHEQFYGHGVIEEQCTIFFARKAQYKLLQVAKALPMLLEDILYQNFVYIRTQSYTLVIFLLFAIYDALVLQSVFILQGIVTLQGACALQSAFAPKGATKHYKMYFHLAA